jgi:hypothetical protein
MRKFNLFMMHKLKPAKTASNPKGAARPSANAFGRFSAFTTVVVKLRKRPNSILARRLDIGRRQFDAMLPAQERK